MKVRELVEVSSSQIECRVNELFRRRPDVKSPPPIRLEAILSFMPNVKLELEPDLLFRYGVEGGIWKEPMTKDLTVFVDYSIYADGTWADYAAVLAEEIAHLELHQGLFLQVQSVEDSLELQRDPAWDRYESDAKEYSRALRMPANSFIAEAEAAYSRVIEDHVYGDPAKIEMHVRTELCKTFRVPRDDARRRMMSYPCMISSRIATSVKASSRTLIPADWTVEAQPPVFQKLFWDDPIKETP